MQYGICICGLNGSGKTTLGAALAERLGYKHMDVEDYYFTRADNPYVSARTRDEVEVLLLEDIKQNPCFVFSAVNGNMNSEINSCYDIVVYLEVPLELRMKRIRQRAFDKFGDRVLPDGDMYEQEEKFFEFAEKRSPEKIEEWLQTLTCRVVRLDGTKAVEYNVQTLIDRINI